MFTFPEIYDVIVVGAGHAGIEAAMAAARLGCETLILTQNLDSIGQMSCNPAIGGQAKGQMVREIDALGGIMGLNTDATGIQFRMLNGKKGPSVRSPRAQCDKKAYQSRAKALLERQPRLDVKQGSIDRILVDGNGAAGIETNLGWRFRSRAVVLTTGTFMRGLLHVGLQNLPGGRMADAVSHLSDNLRELGFEVGRFKTGTPCRLHGRTIDYSQCEPQNGDDSPSPFSFFSEGMNDQKHDVFTLNEWRDGKFHVEQVPCWSTYTNQSTHDIIRANLHQSPLYAGRIDGVGPRYCPSIEDKVVKFSEKDRHQIFLEPEGRHTEEVYVNGVSTSLPMEIQYSFIRSISGLEKAEIMRPGYAVEYDYLPPTQLFHTLETRRIPNLYFAGQINGSSGYEEAAAQGLMAGTNAALKVMHLPAFTLSRADAYIGVLIDDLVTKGTPEPYRMFTSRAEHRLILRHDNADLRLTKLGRGVGLIDDARWASFLLKSSALDELRTYCASTSFSGMRLNQWLKRPENSAQKLPIVNRASFPEELWYAVETDIKYAGYISRQEIEIEKLRLSEDKRIPSDLDFGSIASLRLESRQKLALVRPETVGQAGRISGVTPTDVAILSVYLSGKKRDRAD